MPDEEMDLLRSVLARAHEEPQPFLLRLVLAAKDRVWSRTRQPSIPTRQKYQVFSIEQSRKADR
jgi:hypothetical protein